MEKNPVNIWHSPTKDLSLSQSVNSLFCLTSVSQVSPWPAVSWATVLSQTPKRVVSTPATVPAGNNSGSKGKDDVPKDRKVG